MSGVCLSPPGLHHQHARFMLDAGPDDFVAKVAQRRPESQACSWQCCARKACKFACHLPPKDGTGREAVRCAGVSPIPGAPMPSRRKSPETKSPIRSPTSARPGPAPRAGMNRRSPAPTGATTKRWRRDVRPRAVRSAVSAHRFAPVVAIRPGDLRASGLWLLGSQARRSSGISRRHRF